MNENESFLGGLIVGAIIVIAILIGVTVIRSKEEVSGYKDKMILEYHCPDKEYECQLFNDLVERSGIHTNFTNKEITMDAHRIRYRLTNPK